MNLRALTKEFLRFIIAQRNCNIIVRFHVFLHLYKKNYFFSYKIHTFPPYIAILENKEVLVSESI